MGSNFSNIDVRASIQFVGLWCWRHDINKSACNYLSDFCLIVTDRQALLQEHKRCPLSSFSKLWRLRSQENISSHGYLHLKQAQVFSSQRTLFLCCPHKWGTLLTDKAMLPLSKPNTIRLLAALNFLCQAAKYSNLCGIKIPWNPILVNPQIVELGVWYLFGYQIFFKIKKCKWVSARSSEGIPLYQVFLYGCFCSMS